MTKYEYKTVEVLSDPFYLGEKQYFIPAYQVLDKVINKLSIDNWRIVMMDAINKDMIIAVFERVKEINITMEE